MARGAVLDGANPQRDPSQGSLVATGRGGLDRGAQQQGTGRPRRHPIEISRLVVEDRDDMEVKALSWARRELAQRDPEAVREFLDEHRGTLAARVVVEEVLVRED